MNEQEFNTLDLAMFKNYEKNYLGSISPALLQGVAIPNTKGRFCVSYTLNSEEVCYETRLQILEVSEATNDTNIFLLDKTGRDPIPLWHTEYKDTEYSYIKGRRIIGLGCKVVGINEQSYYQMPKGFAVIPKDLAIDKYFPISKYFESKPFLESECFKRGFITKIIDSSHSLATKRLYLGYEDKFLYMFNHEKEIRNV